VPFAALPGRKHGNYLLEDVALAVVPVPSAIPELLAATKDRLAPSLLALGDLRYGPATAAPGRRETFGRLPATAAEARAVQTAFAELFRGGTVTALSGADATKAAVRKGLTSVRYAHLATHGYFAPETVKSVLAPDKSSRPGEREVSGWHPLLLSGLALGDANREPKPGEEDGILTALEVSEMDLSKLELAVLSACETGLGAVAGGEGLLGLQRAFQVAGCRQVVASLWSVHDGATSVLMERFYHHRWRKKASALEALRQAQLDVLHNPGWVEKRAVELRGLGKASVKLSAGAARSPAAWWAAFVLSGDWR
jgi:CHAT domain-containing protein